MPIQNGGDFFSVVEGLFYIRFVVAISVFFGLIDGLDVDTDTANLGLIIFFMMLPF